MHELAHLFAAICFKIPIAYFAFLPFGVCLKRKNSCCSEIYKEILFYSVGIFVNALMLCIGCVLKQRGVNTEWFIKQNAVFIIINLIPIQPLDGGQLLKKILYCYIGFNRSDKVCKIIGGISVVCTVAAGAYVIYTSGFNMSVVLFTVFVTANYMSMRNTKSAVVIRELMNYKQKPPAKGIKHVQTLAISNDCKMRDVLGEFALKKLGIIYIIDRDGKIIKTVSETELIDDLIWNNGNF